MDMKYKTLGIILTILWASGLVIAVASKYGFIKTLLIVGLSLVLTGILCICITLLTREGEIKIRKHKNAER